MRFHVAGVVLVAALAARPAGAVEAASSASDRNARCLKCHDELGPAFAASAHATGGSGRDYGAPAGTCVACHGASDEHVRSPEKQPPTVAFGDQTPQEVNDACLGCHRSDARQVHWDLHGGASCVSCHSVHTSPPGAVHLLAKSTVTRTCLGCHADLNRSLTQRSRHPVAEGKMDCASCHDPHGTGVSSHLVRASSNTELCLGCHQDKRGPHLWEHAPVREDCANCHTAHGSNHDSLLVTQPARLCQQCHMQGRHQTVAGMPNETWNMNRSCMNCHPAIHGSNHPSGVIFQR